MHAQLVAVAQHGPGGLGDLGQTGQRSSTQDRQRVGKADGFDDVGAGDRNPSRRSRPATPTSQRVTGWSTLVKRW